jgi:hypothetical protein
MEILDLSNVEETGGFEAMPAGKYPVRVIEAELSDTKDGTGQYIKVQLEVIGDDYTNRRLFHNFNIKNKNPKAVEIGLGQLKSLLTKAGSKKTKITSPQDLINLEAVASVKIRKSDEYGDQNVVAGFVDSPKKAQAPQVNSNDIPF